jgi:predicted DCC family thiol-disulfide oxidoreductase YuxK
MCALRNDPFLPPCPPLAILPRPVQDWLYARIARNRYRLFGRTEMCAIADARLKQRLLT